MIHTSTLLARSPAVLLSSLRALSSAHPKHTLLFALSHNCPAPDLEELVKSLTAGTAVGCLSAPFSAYPGHIACSLAFFPSDLAVPFRSTIPGRAAPQVGRWHAFRERESAPRNLPEGEFSWKDVWDRAPLPLPEALIGLKEVSNVVYFTDAAPEGLVSSLGAIPGANKLGLLASSTPFITGRPVTLFYNDKIYDSGAVGLALNISSTVKTSFQGTVPISQPMTVTRREGNMVNTLDNANPTQLLLKAIRATGMDMDASGSFKEDETFILGTRRRMYRITAGDPSRGNLALESENAPAEGTRVQFFHLTRADGGGYDSDERGIQFSSSVGGESSTMFMATSENGFVVGEEEENWNCRIIGSSASILW